MSRVQKDCSKNESAMKKSFLLLLLAGLSLNACRTLRVRDFRTDQSLSTRLPRLGLLVHERSFLAAFDGALDREIIIANAIGGPYQPNPWAAYAVTDQALEDVFRLLNNELDENLNQATGPEHGHARFKLLFYKRRNSGWGWSVLSGGTLFIPNLFGMPVRTYRSEMELQMEITDANGKVLVSYAAPGVGKAQVAAYHGYDGPTATRKANLLALQDAVSKIKLKMEADAPSLIEELTAAGALRQPEGK
jgi:hypothetical protein